MTSESILPRMSKWIAASLALFAAVAQATERKPVTLPTDAHEAEADAQGLLPEGAGAIAHLANGVKVEGVFGGRRDGTLWMLVDQGEIGIEPATIVSMEQANNPTSEFRRRAMLLDAKDSAGLWLLSQWAKDVGLVDSARVAAERTVRADPEHREGRAYLGHEKLNGRWLDHDEVMAAKGLVEYQGEWIPRQQFAQIVSSERRSEQEHRESEWRRERAYNERLQYEYDSMVMRYYAKQAIIRARLNRPRTIWDAPIISRPKFYGPARKR